jgi:hypothetical protein
MDIQQAAARLLGRLERHASTDLRVEQKLLRGGISSPEVVLMTIRYEDASGRQRVDRMIMKRLGPQTAREAVVYRTLVDAYARDISPKLLSIECLELDRVYLALEAIRRSRAWPWRDVALVRLVLERLAHFHLSAADGARLLPPWDYEAELLQAAESTSAALDACRLDPDLSPLSRYRRCVDRLVSDWPRLRRQLLSNHPFAATPIHGDVHPGNVLIRRRDGCDQPVLLDWGRARLGSPLEDLSSWLLSLRPLEGDAERSHDTLLGSYLSALGLERRLTADIRAAYWLAGASNALAGALLHHLAIARDVRQSAACRAAAFRSTGCLLRVIKRADAWCSH